MRYASTPGSGRRSAEPAAAEYTKLDRGLHKVLHAEISRSEKTGAAVAIVNGLPGGHDSTFTARQLRELSECLIRIAEGLDSGKLKEGQEIQQPFTCNYVY